MPWVGPPVVARVIASPSGSVQLTVNALATFLSTLSVTAAHAGARFCAVIVTVAGAEVRGAASSSLAV